jgi:hypothetical protein
VKTTDRTILSVVAVVGLIAAFWFLILAPKRQEASDLDTQVSTLETSVAAQESDAAAAAQSKTDFKTNYKKLVTLGKAIPVDADTPSLLTQLQTLSDKSNVVFQSITLGGASGGAAAPAATTAAPATETTAALLPIGATVGAAGLPVMPYALQFQGGFFQIADFFGRIDGMVDAGGDNVTVDGRLLTIDSFTLAAGEGSGLTASVSATSYLSPADQGTTGGATATGPLSTGVPAATPTTTPTAAPTAVVSP